jgi:hypothetical protein
MSEPSIKFGTQSVFGTMTGWAGDSPSINKRSQRANVLGETGDEVASKLYDEMTETSQQFTAATATAPTLPANIGAILASKVVTSISISTSATDFAKVTMTGHQHTSNPHTSVRNVAHGITLRAGFGATDFLGATAGSDAAVESSTCNITCQHTDIQDGNGDHLTGNNYDARITATVVWHGVPTTPAAAGWDVTSVETKETPTGYLQTTVTAEKALTLPNTTPA